jgi:hypothetical protein
MGKHLNIVRLIRELKVLELKAQELKESPQRKVPQGVGVKTKKIQGIDGLVIRYK